MVVSAPPDACSSDKMERRKGYLGMEIERERGGEDELKEWGERLSIPLLTPLRLSLAVLIHSFSGL